MLLRFAFDFLTAIKGAGAAIRGVIILLSVILGSTFAAHAQSEQTPGYQVGVEPTYVMVIDQDYIVDRSAALADLRPRVDRLTAAWEADLNASRLRLKEQNDIAVETFEPGDEQLIQFQASIQAELEVLGEEVERRKRRLNEINVRAIRLVRRQVTIVAQQLAQERGANMIINKGQGIWVPISLDLTEEVLARINTDYLQVAPLTEEIEADIVAASQ